MLIQHVSLPVVLSREPLPLRSIRAVGIEAVEPLGVEMFVVDMAIQMGLGSESLVAVLIQTYMWSLVISCVVTVSM